MIMGSKTPYRCQGAGEGEMESDLTVQSELSSRFEYIEPMTAEITCNIKVLSSILTQEQV